MPPPEPSSTRTVRLVVDDVDAGMRLDAFLAARMPWRSRHELALRIQRGGIAIGARPRKKAYRLSAGEVVSIEVPPSTEETRIAEIDLTILYEDDDLVVVDKPADLAVHPSSTCLHRNVLSRLRYRFAHEAPDPRASPSIVHRLDRTTSGVLAVARRRELVRGYTEQFERRATHKEYLAIVRGHLRGEGRIETPILTPPAAPSRVGPGGKTSLTEYTAIDHRDDCSLLAVRISTGRKHQIRVHLASIGHPLVHDDIYGDETAARPRPTWARPWLHAASLSLVHRVRGPMTFRAPMPPDMRAAWAALDAQRDP